MRLSVLPCSVVLLTPFVIIMPGCGDPVESLEMDQAFLRRPGEKPAGVKMGSGPLIPTTKGTTFEMVLTPLARDDKDLPRLSPEQIAVTRVEQAAGQTRVTLQTQQNARGTRQEVYLSGSEGLEMAATVGANGGVTFVPPLPLVRYPIQNGDTLTWSGVLKTRAGSAPGNAYSRVSGQDVTPTGIGEFGTYRVDTVIQTTVQGRLTPFQTRRWFAPGIGIVRQWNQQAINGESVLIDRRLRRRTMP
jgi:hypothetical protein